MTDEPDYSPELIQRLAFIIEGEHACYDFGTHRWMKVNDECAKDLVRLILDELPWPKPDGITWISTCIQTGEQKEEVRPAVSVTPEEFMRGATRRDH